MLAALLDPASYAFARMAVPHFVVAALAAAVCGLVVAWERGTRIAWMFAVATALFGLWLIGRGLIRMLVVPELALPIGRGIYVLIMLAIPLLFQLVEVLLRRERERRGLIRTNWIVGWAMAIAAVTTPWVIGGTQLYSWGIEPIHGPLGLVMVGWTTMLMGVASADLWRARRRETPGSNEHRRLSWFGLAMLCLYGAAVDFLPSSGVPVYPVAFVPVLGFILLTAWVTLRFGLVEVTPELAAGELAEMVRGGLLLLDRDGVIQVVNTRVTQVLDRPAAELVGKPAREVLGEAGAPERLAQLARTEDRDAEKELLYTGPGGQARDLALSVSAVHDRHSRAVAWVCLLRDVTEQKRAAQERLSEGLNDRVTGLPNRTLFLDRLESAVRHAGEAGGRPYAVCFVGIDRMRIINEDLGYAVGDRVLIETAQRLRRLVTHAELVARLGGDEFGILIERPPHPGYVKAFVERLQQALRAPLLLDDHQLYLSISVGLAGHELAPSGGADLLRKASVAMYRVKERGGGGVHVVSAGEVATQRTHLESDLRRAIEAAEFRVYYQPVMHATERKLAGFEALVRWQHPERGLLLPGDFLEFAEQVGLITAIDCHVLAQACTDLQQLLAAAGERGLTVNINMAEEVLRRPDIVERVAEQLQRNRLRPAALQIEVLERVALVPAARDNLQRLRALGVALCVDDFGTGYSALSRLHTLPITALKIDREFVRAMSLGQEGEKIIGSILALGENLGLRTIAEGAGMAHEVLRLIELGCPLIQGFYFSPGVPVEQALQMVRDPAAFAAQFRELDLLAQEAALEARAAGIR
ncbi:MAG TPA: EAL domain-containing protein [Candidatus Binatia bacterium]|nr:EAL domain-containing protein [Candidatus Binatia bacterium]